MLTKQEVIDYLEDWLLQLCPYHFKRWHTECPDEVDSIMQIVAALEAQPDA